MPLREQLQQTLGAAYTLERELGGGGMSRVFLARDESLRRNVVVKVLPPELIAGVNVERFDREIELAAGLQHPHIVPVLAAGQMDGLPYYTMPFVDGESLRARIARDGSLPLTEAVGYLRDVAKALAYAHERGVVHRDIKPDNVLVSGGSATVTDFGIAKALSASRTEAPNGTLTQVGMSIGTPAYMSPEQAAGDPATDHRADIYSFGCLAYELLAGRPPFVAKTPQRLLAAHMTELPQPIRELRPDTPASLADLIGRCLSKEAEHRPRTASDIVRVLESVTSGGTEAMPHILLSGRRMLLKALAVYAVAFISVAILARAAIVAIGLPEWVLSGALVVMALGLPMILLTAYAGHAARRAITRTPTYTPGGTSSVAEGTMATLALRASPHLSWRRTAIGGAWAVGAFALLVGAYMLMRASGVGPFGSLLAAGTVAKDEKLLVADFPSPAGDSTLGPVVTEAFRTALGQSQSVNVLQQNAIAGVLRRMERPSTTRIDFAVAREIAAREGVRGIIDGNLIGIGGRYVVSAKLMSPQSGEQLAEFTEKANSQSDLLPAIDKLARQVRARIGESLKKVAKTPPLEQVTTPSLDALRKYVLGARLVGADGDFAKGTALLEEAVALDTSFAMAYRKLAISYVNRGVLDRGNAYHDKAFAHRDRLSDAERYLVEASYYDNGSHEDIAKSRVAYEQLLELQPNNAAALNNLGNIYRVDRNYAKALELYTRALDAGPASAVFYANLIRTNLRLGRPEEAMRQWEAFAKTFPANGQVLASRAEIWTSQQKYDSLGASIDADRARLASDKSMAGEALIARADVARVEGKLIDARRFSSEGYRLLGEDGAAEAPLMFAADDASTIAWFYGDSDGAVRILDDALAHHSIDSLAYMTAPFGAVVFAYNLARRPEKARAVMARWEEGRKRFSAADDFVMRHMMLANLALASGRYDEAASQFRAGDVMGCDICPLPRLGQAYDLGGHPDSAIAVYTRYIETPSVVRSYHDGMFLPAIHKRLGELYEAKGDRQNAITHYTKFVELWKNADPALQPKVAEVKAKIARLSRMEGK